MKLMIVGMIAICAAPLMVQAQDVAPPAKAKKAPNPNRKVCRSEASTGSHMPVSTCHTADEWRQIDASNQRDQDTMRSSTGLRN